jgi:hypothetical protein
LFDSRLYDDVLAEVGVFAITNQMIRNIVYLIYGEPLPPNEIVTDSGGNRLPSDYNLEQ